MKKIFLVLMLSLMAGQAMAACDYPDDIAADGTRCGGRAASERPGGR
jgi:hypothetical protein